jgi:hypothetical protein
MQQELINHSPDLKRLKDEGYGIQVKGGLLVVHRIPYVNNKMEIAYGKLVSELSLVGTSKTDRPKTHVIHFAGEFPCFPDGHPITALKHGEGVNEITKGITVNFSFSNKPGRNYLDYYEKISSYANIISAPAKALDDSVTEKSFMIFEDDANDSVFMYIDTNSSRANITSISEKLRGQKIAIIGTGGTGSYILDFVSKTPVQEIHLYDVDRFYVHNAFRCPGAASIEELNSQLKKVEYLYSKYSKIHKGIVPHGYHITSETVKELTDKSFVFISIDEGEIKKLIIDTLLEAKVPFIDVGMGIDIVKDSLIGTIRVTSGNDEVHEHLKKRISFADDEDDGYNSNIQIAELNALNAALAVIKWKKILGFYNDMEKEYHTTFIINESQLLNDEAAA